MPHISVVIPVYNAENYIVDTLISVLRQSLKDIEVIVVNDGSNDNSLVECYKLQELDKRITIINQENQGVSVARNVGKQNEEGFEYPQINENKCVCCYQCIKVCPIKAAREQ